jgi:glycosyltransferase involved in cell wall biosynthesis
MSARRLWIVTPVYRDVGPFLTLRESISEAVEKSPALRDRSVRFVVLDDTAGRDPEVARLQALDDVEVILPPFNLGHQRGIVYALRMAMPQIDDSDIVVTLDADGEDRPEDLPRMVATLLGEPAERNRIVLALRGRRQASFALKCLYVLFRLLFRALTGTTVRTGNFAAYRGWVARRALLHPSFDLSYSSTMLTLDFPIRYILCERGQRYAGNTRMGYAGLFTHAMRMLMPFTERIARRAMLTFLATLVMAVALALVVVAVRLFTDAAIPGWATYTLLAMTILSVIAVGNLVILFTIFSQSRAMSLSNLEEAGSRMEAPEAGALTVRTPQLAAHHEAHD